jgi:predicted nuclease of predicted toxin-antitoxin system
MRLKIDENLPIDVADILRAAGHDAHSVYDESLAGAEDEKLAAVARQERRGFITLDLDFADIRAYPPQEYSGIIVLRISRQDKNHVLDTISRLLPVLQSEELLGRLWIVDDRRIRIRE